MMKEIFISTVSRGSILFVHLDKEGEDVQEKLVQEIKGHSDRNRFMEGVEREGL